jgi:hypothetical protein
VKWLCLVVVLASCRREPVVKDDPVVAPKKKATDVLARYPIPKRLTSKTRIDDSGTVKHNRREEVCERVSEAPPTWNCEGKETGDDPFQNTMRYRLLPEGLVYDAIIVDGTPHPIEPPKIALPHDVHVGSNWSAEHTTNGKKHTRACDVRAYATCDDGLSITCVTRYDDGRVITVNDRSCGG